MVPTISADALWQSAFGVACPELEEVEALNQVAATLDLLALNLQQR